MRFRLYFLAVGIAVVVPVLAFLVWTAANYQNCELHVTKAELHTYESQTAPAGKSPPPGWFYYEGNWVIDEKLGQKFLKLEFSRECS